MGTCKGCWRDEHVPADVGVVVTLGGNNTFKQDYVWHAPNPECTEASPHAISLCTLFEVPRPGYEPDADRPRDRWVEHITCHEWGIIFDRIEQGLKIFPFIDFLSQLHFVHNSLREKGYDIR